MTLYNNHYTDRGELVYPGHHLLGDASFFPAIFNHIVKDAAPTVASFTVFTGFLLVELILAAILPGPITHGLPIASENGIQVTNKR